jgi:hypothetical protein
MRFAGFWNCTVASRKRNDDTPDEKTAETLIEASEIIIEGENPAALRRELPSAFR